jgi:hypothetical protein
MKRRRRNGCSNAAVRREINNTTCSHRFAAAPTEQMGVHAFPASDFEFAEYLAGLCCKNGRSDWGKRAQSSNVARPSFG